jgi:spore maturation protein CgeB
MRWLLAHPGPQFSVHDVYVGWRDALRLAGEKVHIFNLDDRLAFYDTAVVPCHDTADKFRKALTGEQAIELAMNGLAAALFKIRPEVLMVVSGFFTDAKLLDQARRYGTIVVLLATESPYEDARQLELAEHVDLMLLNDPVNIEQYRAVTKAVYVPHAYRPHIHHPGPSGYDTCDLAFVGTGYPSRTDFLGAMNLHDIDLVLAGNWMHIDPDHPLRRFLAHDIEQCCDNIEAADLYRSARCGINLYRREADDEGSSHGVAMGPREVEMSACGLFFLRDPRPESDEVLGMLPSFDSPDEASDLLRWYLARPPARQRLALMARDAIANRTFDDHVAQLLRLFDRRPVTVSSGG